MNDIWRKILLGLDEISCWNYLQVERNLLNNEVFMERYLKLKYPDFLITSEGENKEKKKEQKQNKENKYKNLYVNMIKTIKKFFLPLEYEYKRGNFHNQALILKLYVDSRTDTDNYTRTQTMLNNVVRLEEIPLIEAKVLDYSPQLEDPHGNRIYQMLVLACEWGKSKVLKYMINKCKNHHLFINEPVYDMVGNMTCVELACESGNIECVKILLQYGGVISFDKFNLEESSLNDNIQMVTYLVEEVGLDATTINITHDIYRKMNREVFKYLASKGAKVSNYIIQDLITDDKHAMLPFISY